MAVDVWPSTDDRETPVEVVDDVTGISDTGVVGVGVECVSLAMCVVRICPVVVDIPSKVDVWTPVDVRMNDGMFECQWKVGALCNW